MSVAAKAITDSKTKKAIPMILNSRLVNNILTSFIAAGLFYSKVEPNLAGSVSVK
jgi:hypothetical protein